jgi:predicted Zn finger-like uncharacterized protein
MGQRMIITCDECNSSFSVSDSQIKDTGSKVRCSKCNSIFVAYPQSTEDIEGHETAEKELTLDSEDQMLGEDEEFGLDDLDSDLSDLFDDDEVDEILGRSSDIEEPELDLDNLDNSLAEEESDLESSDVLGETKGGLELDLDFDQEDDSDLAMDEESLDGDDLPDLDDLNLDELTADAADSELEDLDFELESETDAELDLKGGDELDLSDLDLAEEDILAVEDSSAEQDQTLKVEDSDELDLSDLETAIDDETVFAETAEADAEDLNFDLETDEQDLAEITETDLEAEASDELDFSDLDIELEDASASEEASAVESADFDLEAETVDGSQEAAADELDLSDITDILEDEDLPAAEAQPEELDLDLEFESEASTDGDEPAAVADSGDVDELNLTDLEEFIETEDAPATVATADDSAQDLDFLLEDDAATNETAADSESEDELDFSDLEQMLESDETPSAGATEISEAEELDLQFDLDEPSIAEADAEAAADPGDDDQEDDFLDIEQLLEDGESNEPSENAVLDGDVTDLPLEMEAALDDASKGADAELELDFDLESELQAQDGEDLFEAGESTDQQLESNLLASDEVDFLEEAGIEETEFQNETETSLVGTDEFVTDEPSETDGEYGPTHVLPNSESEVAIAESFEPEPVTPVSSKKRSKKPVVVIILLFLLAFGVLIVPNMLGIKIPYISDIKIPYLSDLDVKIPYLSDWLNPEPQDVAGNLKIIPLGNTINGKFVDNSKSGQLFVIRGQIKNDYDHPRSYIKVTGKLYLKSKKIAKAATVYCGNMLSNSDLAAMDIKAISKKLRNRSGVKKSNFKVKTGKRVPFMIVFDKLPRNLDEFTVEVEGSNI